MLNRLYELSVQRNAFKNKSQTDFRRHGLLFLTMHLSSGQYECLFSSTLFTRLNSKKLVKSSCNTLHQLLVWWHNSTAQILIPWFRRSYIIFYPEYHSVQKKLKKIQELILYQRTPRNLSEQLEEENTSCLCNADCAVISFHNTRMCSVCTLWYGNSVDRGWLY